MTTLTRRNVQEGILKWKLFPSTSCRLQLLSNGGIKTQTMSRGLSRGCNSALSRFFCYALVLHGDINWSTFIPVFYVRFFLGTCHAPQEDCVLIWERCLLIFDLCAYREKCNSICSTNSRGRIVSIHSQVTRWVFCSSFSGNLSVYSNYQSFWININNF